MFKQVSNAVLITGANRGLGLQLAKKLATEKRWRIFITARDVDDMKSIFSKESISYEAAFKLDLFHTTLAEIKAIFDSLPGLAAVIHCAAPYTKTLISKATDEETQQYSHCMFLDQIIMKHAVQKLKQSNKGVLAVTGAVVGLPHIVSRGLMGLVKSNQRQLAETFEHELSQESVRNTYIRHFDLGTFAENVIDHNKCLETSFVVDVILNALEKPAMYPSNIHLVASQDEADFKICATTTPKVFYNRQEETFR